MQKVVWFAISIAEASAEVEQLFSQIFHIVNKDRNRLGTHSIKGLLVTKSYIQTIGTCLNFKIDSSMMACINVTHSKYVKRTTSDKNDKCIQCIHRRILEDAKKTLEGNKKMKTIEVKKMNIEKQKEAIKLNQLKSKMLLEKAHLLIKNSEKKSNFLKKEKKELDKAEKQLQQSIFKSTCHKVVKKKFNDMLSTVDINNNESD
ncbi:unnamed protein product [Meganyctiphanes norvegica]|uniref:Uncharacterized protein n=1 Tax=Meganyctiphanes norvegica TaxID=48144 RepID=A0AAV2QVW5_MEGNR